ncbi:MAG: hypothetical protein E6J91_23005 [Deltaproteobacteria bacterium]|nr:MAG: hypothetical protein E6J91_23005 [Deltaproteobacteria bacterium]
MNEPALPAQRGRESPLWIDIARRTVAKYREQLGILSSSKRKQVF